ncbi:hypothetical protein OUZ56_029994 [Daphnia magna]|uniref:Uncharacterized protein n=1 Tax=Daphnia magna TaxID=35525 RepID=A0ABR0B8H7_9CRUS|nr:hypothetical protein OUZ56_029994 [Daphnia magna]
MIILSQLAALDYWLVYATRSCQVVIFDIKRISEELFGCVRAPRQKKRRNPFLVDGSIAFR